MATDEMPRVGQGTWPITDRAACVQMVKQGLDIGYRHIDTAQMYGNEEHVGEAIATSHVPRESIFLATKIDGEHLGAKDVRRSARESAARLQVDTIDLLYVHFPRGAYDPAETLPALDDLVDQGVIRHIGLSNFTPAYLDEALDHLEHELFAHQAEMHPLLHQRELRRYAREHGHGFVAHTPLARGAIFDVPLLTHLATERDISVAELTLAWLLDKDNVAAIPKSTDTTHLAENFAARHIGLDEEAVERIDSLHEFRQERVNNPDNPAWKWQLPG